MPMHSISTFIGRLHPLLVHLPIGFLLMALLLQYASGREKFAPLSAAVPFVLLIGVFSAFASCITGLLLSSGGEYDNTTVSLHMWMGIGTALVSAMLYAQRRTGRIDITKKIMSGALLCLILITGHLGGSLTHGSDYLSSAFSEDTPAKGGFHRKPIPDVQQAMVFNDIIQPLLAGKCYNCHGPARQKGKLRMDKPELLMQGGKDGPVIIPGKAAESEMIKRLTLPLEDEHHMAPKEKPQLSEQEKALLSWWIATGASFTKRVNELAQTDKIKPVLLSLQNEPEEGNGSGKMSNDDVPEEPVASADEKSLSSLRGKGASVLPVAQNSHYIEVNFMNDSAVTDRDMQLLMPFRQQLISLKLTHTSITDSALYTISSCGQLIRLNLDHTSITDKGLSYITSLSRLKYINLVGTGITLAGVQKLKGLQKLKAVYLYQTRVDKKQWPALQSSFKGVRLDSGGYAVPFLPVDTVIVRPPVPKK